MRKISFIVLLFFVSLSGCFEAELVFEDQFEPVVEAYLFKNQDVTNIKVSSMFSFGSDTTIGGQKITDALALLSRENEIWHLVHNDADSGSYYLDADLIMESGDVFDLTVTLDEEILSAETVIPENPPLISMSTNEIRIEDVDDIQDFRDVVMPDPIEFTWDNPDSKYYFFRVQNIEAEENAIMPDPPADMPFRKGGFNFQMDTRPINSNFFVLEPRELTHFGTHQIIIYSVNDEYVNLYNSQEQDSGELNEPFSNIENGLGIFTAFSSDTMYLEVVPVD